MKAALGEGVDRDYSIAWRCHVVQCMKRWINGKGPHNRTAVVVFSCKRENEQAIATTIELFHLMKKLQSQPTRIFEA